ncbi:MAG: hypothetical protein A2148_07430 [Chloroflexi bacterium RBG_16_68_14]|nr:MAG: hypothetical protein A2148_07430 [Chloroflexi bacterium RBG_16_68_14]
MGGAGRLPPSGGGGPSGSGDYLLVAILLALGAGLPVFWYAGSRGAGVVALARTGPAVPTITVISRSGSPQRFSPRPLPRLVAPPSFRPPRREGEG